MIREHQPRKDMSNLFPDQNYNLQESVTSTSLALVPLCLNGPKAVGLWVTPEALNC